jgi:gluconolactonase
MNTSTLKSILMTLGLGLMLPWIAAAASPSSFAPAPAASIDLTTAEGVAQVQGTWRYADVELTQVTHHAPDAAGQPTGAPVRTWDITPHAGGREFDDGAWAVIEPATLKQRRGNGRLSFAWYRIAITVPSQVGGVDTRGASLELATSIDDYAEIWVDGELPRAAAQSGGSVIGGWNAVNRLVIGRNVKPGQKIQLAVFGANGPLSDPPANFIWMRLARLELRAHQPGDDEPVAVMPAEVNVQVLRKDPALDAIVPANAKIFKLAEGFQFTEGPIWQRDRHRLLFSDPNANRIYAFEPKDASTPGELSVFREQSGYAGADVAEYSQPGSNGLTLDSRGRLTINQHGNRRVVRDEAQGLAVLADRYHGRRLNSPNDLIYRSDGTLYFTDPPFGLPKFFDDPRKELAFSGVYRVKDGRIALVSDELTGPNGIAFSPEERFLYVGDWDPKRKVVLRFPVHRDGSTGRGEVFADMSAELPGEAALDGLKVDQAGNLYVAAPDGVRIYSAAGRHLGTIVAPRTVHNMAWGGENGRTLFLCAHDRLYRIELLQPGVRP